MKAIAKNVRISSKKVNLIAGLVRNKEVQAALDLLKFTPKKAAGIIAKVIESAAANAENNLKQKREDLIIKEIIVNEGVTYKRSVPASRGKVHPIRKRNAHITIALGTKPIVPTTTTTEKKKEEVVKEEPKTDK